MHTQAGGRIESVATLALQSKVGISRGYFRFESARPLATTHRIGAPHWLNHSAITSTPPINVANSVRRDLRGVGALVPGTNYQYVTNE